jgi:hypothetical protein
VIAGRGNVHRNASEAKGVFCLEGDWENDLKHPQSCEPTLRLLSENPPYYAPSIHRNIGTRNQFNHYIRKWLQAAYASYPILYLPFHGTAGTIQFGDLRKTENIISLDDLEQTLSGRCKGRIVYFSSCDTLAENGNRLRGFVRRTDALAVCGFRSSVDWLTSVAFDLLFLREAQFNAFTIAGVRSIEKRISVETGGLSKKLGFHMVVNDH